MSIATPVSDPATTSSDAYRAAISKLNVELRSPVKPDPFILEGVQFNFDWCKPRPGRNTSLKDLTNRLEHESARSRDFAQLYAATGSITAYKEAISIIVQWAQFSTLFNAYKEGASPESASFPGIEKGFCNRSWNMMLDSIWQTYGLINFSESYSILKHAPVSQNYQEELTIIKDWIKDELVPAVNAGFHAWTKYADTHPTSRAYIRYRSDNHLSWSLAGLATAGLALNDRALLDYVYYGTAYDDGLSGPYKNPSSLTKLIPFAIKPSGEIFDEAERTANHKGFFYGNFSLWAIVITALNTEQAGYPAIWETQLSPESGTIAAALDRYAPYVAGEDTISDEEETTKPEFFSFVYRIVLNSDWVKGDRLELYRKAASAAASQNIRQGLGSIDLITVKPENIKKK